jgi:predicted SAM-dependent methyltransferase
MKDFLKTFPAIYKSLLKIKHSLWLKDTKDHLTTYLSNQKTAKLQLGAGINYLTGWFNTDYFPRKNIFFLDVTKPFPIPSNSFEFMFSEHQIEHISYKNATEMLKEIFRTMKPGGYIRISTPDLQKYLDSYLDDTIMKNDKDQHAKNWIYTGFYNAVNYIPVDDYYKAHFVNDIFLNYEHFFIYDYQSLAIILKKAGFEEITNCSFKDSHHTEFERYFTLCVEAQKPLA